MCNLKERIQTSLVVQWLRIRLPMQGTWVQSLAQKDPTCCRATNPCDATPKPICPRDHALQEARALQLESSPHLPQLYKAHMQQGRSSEAKNKQSFKNNNKKF